MKQNRNKGLDLLRIISMMMVIGLHFFNHTAVCEMQFPKDPLTGTFRTCYSAFATFV